MVNTCDANIIAKSNETNRQPFDGLLVVFIGKTALDELRHDRDVKQQGLNWMDEKMRKEVC